MKRPDDDQQFGHDMGRRAEQVGDLFESIPEPKWVPCPRKKHHINQAWYPRCVECEREDFDREQNRRIRGGRRRSGAGAA